MLQKLMDMQWELDQKIVRTKQIGLDEDELLNQRIHALFVEVGEMSNEVRGFKYWSNKGPNWNKAREEYIDCLHFMLSIGNHLFDNDSNAIVEAYREKNLVNYERQKNNY